MTKPTNHKQINKDDPDVPDTNVINTLEEDRKLLESKREERNERHLAFFSTVGSIDIISIGGEDLTLELLNELLAAQDRVSKSEGFWDGLEFARLENKLIRNKEEDGGKDQIYNHDQTLFDQLCEKYDAALRELLMNS